MSLLHFRCKERRRTLRVMLSVPLTIHGKNEAGEKFCMAAHSHSVNRHGALIPFDPILIVGQSVLLVNDITAQSIECRVVSVRRPSEDGKSRDTRTYIGVEFLVPDNNFWHMAFPTPGARPLRRTSAPAGASTKLA